MISTEKFIIKPSWKKIKSKGNRAVITIDPGMAFGTGHHFTTLYCIKELQKYSNKKGRFLDIGCGSGILSIVASMCGMKYIVAIDNSKDAVEISKKNFKSNCCGKKAVFKHIDIEKFCSSEKFTTIACNLYDTLILRYSEKIMSLMENESIIILSGIRIFKADEIKRAFKGCVILNDEISSEREWYGITLKKYLY